jgi:hypothetical protein
MQYIPTSQHDQHKTSSHRSGLCLHGRCRHDLPKLGMGIAQTGKHLSLGRLTSF